MASTRKPVKKSAAKTLAKSQGKTPAKNGGKKPSADPKALEFLYSYLNNTSPTGFEASGQKIWLDYLRPYIDDVITDVYGTAVGVINPGMDYKVVIEAHSDEISWFVKFISEDGYIYIKRNGGSDHAIAPSMRVNIHGDKGIVPGIFGWAAIHIREPGKEETPNLNNIFIDVGAATKDEVLKMGIHVGTVITFVDGLMELNNKFFVGRALDNRMGGFMISQVARRIKENKIKLPFTLYIVNSVQEEIGLHGAEMISRRLKPDLAICTDMTHDTQSPIYNKRNLGDIACGRGPVVGIGASIHNNVHKVIVDTAAKKKIAFQHEALSRATGTDTDAFAYSAEGIASALVSVPVKYMHTTVEMVRKSDVDGAIDLLYEVLVSLKGNEDFSYLKSYK